ncbi:MAG TPA: hypothetical protein VLE47_00755 [Candidatus Saccharimonadales bacterium]|nr:hypothetical protein [Candidatus Saccharimonadales bacterium]
MDPVKRRTSFFTIFSWIALVYVGYRINAIWVDQVNRIPSGNSWLAVYIVARSGLILLAILGAIVLTTSYIALIVWSRNHYWPDMNPDLNKENSGEQTSAP